MDVLLSICVPSYNRSELLKRLTNQLLLLKSEKIEFVFLDDRSSDKEVMRHLRDIEQNDKRVRVYENSSNLGITENYYSSLKHANGKYAMLLSNEDQIPNNFVEIVLPLLEDHDYDAVFGFLKRSNKKDYHYKNEHPKKTTSDLDFIKKYYPNLVFRGHISGQIYKKNKIDFEILSKLSTIKDNYWPIAPITLMMMKDDNILVIKDSFVIVGADCLPETEKILRTNKKRKEVKHLFSYEKRADLYSNYVMHIIKEDKQTVFLKILARYFIYFSFRKKHTGISKLKDINALKKHPIIGKYFKEEVAKQYLKNYFSFYMACLNKYFSFFVKNKN